MAVEHREAVVLRWQFALADGVHADVDGDRGAAKLLLTVVLRQHGLEGAGLPGGQPDDPVDDRGDDLLTVQLEVALDVVPAGQDLIAAAHDQDAFDDVSCLRRTVDLHELGVLRRAACDRLVDVLLR